MTTFSLHTLLFFMFFFFQVSFYLKQRKYSHLVNGKRRLCNSHLCGLGAKEKYLPTLCLQVPPTQNKALILRVVLSLSHGGHERKGA